MDTELKKDAAEGFMERIVRCFLDDPDMPQCCCNCSLHVEICKPWTNCGKTDGSCDCGTRKEWGCAAFLTEGKIIGDWPEHSCGCEMYTPNVRALAQPGAQDSPNTTNDL